MNRSYTPNIETSSLSNQKNTVLISDPLSKIIHKISVIQFFLDEAIESLKSVYELEKIDKKQAAETVSELCRTVSIKDEIIRSQERRIMNFCENEKLNEEKSIYLENKGSKKSKKKEIKTP